MEEICGKKKLKNPKIDTLQHLSVQEMKDKLYYIKKIHKLNRLQLCIEILKQKHIKIKKSPTNNLELGFIAYDNKNSCYIDTTIMALFHRPKVKWINDNFFKNELPHSQYFSLYQTTDNIRQELQTIYKNLHSIKQDIKCSNLRNLFSIFDKQYKIAYNVNPEKIEWIRSQQEPNDILNILLRIFKIPPTIKIRQVFKKSKQTDKFFFNSIQIDVGELINNNIVYLKNYIPKTKDIIHQDDGSTNLKTTLIIQAKLLFVNINRNYLGEQKLITSVIPEEYFKICATKSPENCKKIIKCVSIIIHHGNSVKGGHYTCVFKFYKDDQWYHYDDLQSKYILIGNFKNILEWNDNYITKNMVGCIYL